MNSTEMKNIKKPSYAVVMGKGLFMANDKGHKFTTRICVCEHRCAECGEIIEPGETEIEHNFKMHGCWCTEYYHENCL